jgi:gas vesicle protein
MNRTIFKHIPEEAKALYYYEKRYSETLKHPNKWLEIIEDSLKDQYKQLNKNVKQEYKKRVKQLQELLKETDEDNKEETDDVTQERAKKKMKLTPVKLSLDADSLLVVFSFFTSCELSRLRLVSKNFDSVLHSNYLWKCLFVSEFSGELSLQESDDYFALYRDAYTRIPRLIKTTVESMEDVDGTYNVDDSDGKDTRRIDFSVMKVSSCAKGTDKSMHKVAAILSILNCNDYYPDMNDMVRIGYAHNFKRIKLSHFCYALLADRQSELFEEEEFKFQYNDDEDIKDKYNSDYEEEFEGELDFRRKADRNRLVSVGVAPDVEGPFEPFVYYLHVTGNTFYDFKTYSDVPIIENRKIKHGYIWETDEKGWICPAFFNASFVWFHCASFITLFCPEEKEIVVMKMEQGYAVF